MNVAFPFHVDDRRRSALAEPDDHVRQLVEQVLFTSPGERVNRPTFGTGVYQLVFAANSPELAAAVQFLVQGALQQHLADVIEVARVAVDAVDAELRVTIDYVVRATGQAATASLASPVGAP